MSSMTRTLGATLLAAWLAPALADGDPEHGKLLYQERCSACHSPKYNGPGPAHRGVYGRRAARAPGFDYSPALRGADVTWDDTTLARWLADPEKFVPGQKMGFSVPDAAERADLIAYLRTLK